MPDSRIPGAPAGASTGQPAPVYVIGLGLPSGGDRAASWRSLRQPEIMSISGLFSIFSIRLGMSSGSFCKSPSRVTMYSP